MSKISILGSGGWGTALAVMCSSMGHEVSLWSVFEAEINEIKSNGENKLLKGVKIPEDINLTTDISCVKNAELVILATPSFAVKSTCEKIKELLAPDAIVANVAKGIDEDSLSRLSEVMQLELREHAIVVISGPSHAEEVARGIPTTVVCSSLSSEAARKVQNILINDRFRVYTNDDIVGVELGGALKNIIALAAGICDGLGLGDNTIAALLTRGLAETARLGVAMGANIQTFMGLSGLGDLVVTCTSKHSRNRRFGTLIGKGYSAKDALDEVAMTVEGYHATRIAHKLGEKYGVELPIINQCYKVLYEGFDPKESIQTLMSRPQKEEGKAETTYIDIFNK